MKSSLKISETATGRVGLLSFGGDLTMAYAREIKKTLLEALEQIDTLQLDLHDIGSVDVSLIQLICATHRECIVSGKNIFLQDGLGDTMTELLHRAGYCKQLGCPAEGRSTCLWEHGCQR